MAVFTNQVIENVEEGLIAGIDQPVVLQYFANLNAGEFQAVSELFAINGALQPPFEDMIVGRSTIAAYLEREAKGFLLQPLQGNITHLDDGCTIIEVMGKVQTPWFSVNASWTFTLTLSQEIFVVKVSLLATLQELFPVRDFANKGE